MTRRDSRDPAGNKKLKQALAAIISSTRTKTRPMPLTQVACWIKIAVNKLGSYKALSEKVGVSEKMLRQFSYVLDLAKPVRLMFDRRELDSVDAAAHLKLFSPSEQIVVARALANRDLDTSDVRAISQLKRVRQSEPIRSLLSAVRNSKTKQHYVAEFVVRGDATAKSIEKSVSRYLSQEAVVAIKVDGPIGRLVVTSEGRAEMSRLARQLGVPFKDIVVRILGGHSSI
jgi:hypothetical protein